MRNWSQPTSQTKIRSFLGIAGYYRRFVQDFSKIDKPKTRLLKKGIPYEWNSECEEAFLELKRRLTTTLVLTLPKEGGEFDVYSDASHKGLGCVLMQDG